MADVSIVICRQASDYLKPGFVTGYRCAICQKELQVSPAAVTAIAKGARVLCNPCGVQIRERLIGSGQNVTEVFSSTAVQQAIEMLRRAN